MGLGEAEEGDRRVRLLDSASGVTDCRRFMAPAAVVVVLDDVAASAAEERETCSASCACTMSSIGSGAESGAGMFVCFWSCASSRDSSLSNRDVFCPFCCASSTCAAASASASSGTITAEAICTLKECYSEVLMC